MSDWQALVTEHLEFARRLARTYAKKAPSFAEEAEGAAMIGLVQAAKAYRAERGVPFELYAKQRIGGAIRDEARAFDELGRGHRRAVRAGEAQAPVHVGFEDLQEVLPASGVVSMADWASARDLQQLLRHLPRRLQLVARRTFIDEASLATIGSELGVTESRVCQLLGQVTERLRVRMQPFEPAVSPEQRSAWSREVRRAGKATLCLRGHQLKGYNLVVTKRGGRRCRHCMVTQNRQHRWRAGAQPFAALRRQRHPNAKLSDAVVRAALTALAAGERVTPLARRLGVAPLVIRHIRDGRTYRSVPRPPAFQPMRRRYGKLSDGQAREIFDRLASGETARTLAKEFGVSPSAISDIRRGRYHRRADRAALPDGRRTVRNAKAKLSPAQVAETRAALAAGARVADEARRLGVAWNTIKALRDGTSYRWITPPAPPAARAPLRSAA